MRGTPGNDWTDTEFVVQNPSTSTDAYVQFTLCEANGTTCWSNNNAVVRKGGHRIFLLSQLAYQNNNGSLTEKSGSLSAKLTVTNSVPVATMANMFRQSVPTTKTLPMAETGAKWMMSFGQQRVAGSGVIPRFYRESGDASGGYSHAVKVQNLGTSSTTVTVELRDANGNVPTNGTVSKSVGANAIADFNSYEFNVSAGTYAARIYSNGSHNLAAWHWRSGSEGYYGDVWQPYSTVLTGTFLPVVRAGVWSWSTTVGSYASNVSTWGYYPGELEMTVGGSYNTSVGLGNDRHTNQNAGSSFTSAPTYGNLHTTSGFYFGSSANLNSMPVIYKSGSGDTRVAYNATWQTASTWYVPFAPAPVVGFGWSTSHETGHPDAAQFGFAGNPTVNGSPTWASDMNWYVWPRMHVSSEWAGARDSCQNSRYLLMDKGLVDVSGAYNSYNRLNTIRNLAPSACAGRPLLLANEPNFTDQANMTHKELARHVFVYRNWSGDLHSPAYGDAWGWSAQDIGTDHGYTESDGYTNPIKTDFVDFKNYWSGLTFGGSLPYDSVAVHLYLLNQSSGIDTNTTPITMSTTRQDEIGEWYTEATNLGINNILVTEYGMTPNVDPDPNGQDDDTCVFQCLADGVPAIHSAVKQKLGSKLRRMFVFVFKDPNYWALWTGAELTRDFNTGDTSIYVDAKVLTTGGEHYFVDVDNAQYEVFSLTNASPVDVNGDGSEWKYTVNQRHIEGTNRNWLKGTLDNIGIDRVGGKGGIAGVDYKLSDIFKSSTFNFTLYGQAWHDDAKNY